MRLTSTTISGTGTQSLAMAVTTVATEASDTVDSGTVTSQPSLLDPETTVAQGRPRRSTRRDPSLFETVGSRVRRRREREAGA
jgi:hypothetical protein